MPPKLLNRAMLCAGHASVEFVRCRELVKCRSAPQLPAWKRMPPEDRRFEPAECQRRWDCHRGRQARWPYGPAGFHCLPRGRYSSEVQGATDSRAHAALTPPRRQLIPRVYLRPADDVAAVCGAKKVACKRPMARARTTRCKTRPGKKRQTVPPKEKNYLR